MAPSPAFAVATNAKLSATAEKQCLNNDPFILGFILVFIVYLLDLLIDVSSAAPCGPGLSVVPRWEAQWRRLFPEILVLVRFGGFMIVLASKNSGEWIAVLLLLPL